MFGLFKKTIKKEYGLYDKVHSLDEFKSWFKGEGCDINTEYLNYLAVYESLNFNKFDRYTKEQIDMGVKILEENGVDDNSFSSTLDVFFDICKIYLFRKQIFEQPYICEYCRNKKLDNKKKD